MASASLCISSSKLRIVTLAVFIAVAGALSPALAETQIEAKVYDIKTVRPSKSGRVYLFEKSEAGLPVSGKLFLIREGATPVMAMRALKTYSATNRIAAKKLKTYSGFEVLERGSIYRAFEKTGDSVQPVPPSAEDTADITELESSENEESIPPIPEESIPPVMAPQESAEIGELESAEINIPREESPDESDIYFPNQFTMAIGNIPNSNIPGPDFKFSGGFLYGRSFEHDLAFETGFYYYKASGDVENIGNVTMTVVPVTGSLRIQKKYGNLWTGYAYGGFIYPYIASEIGATNALLRKIQVLSPALGVGAFLQTGPNWYLRLNLGLESMTLGVMLRF